MTPPREAACPHHPAGGPGGIVSHLSRSTQIYLAERLLPCNIGSGQFPDPADAPESRR